MDGCFVSMQMIDQDHFTHGVHYDPGRYTFTREEIGTRYVALALRSLANPNDPADMDKVHALQDAITVEQAANEQFEIPQWHKESQQRTRKALLELSSLLPDATRMFGTKEQIDPVRHLIGAAMGWGGNPDADAFYLNRTEAQNDADTIHRIKIGNVPVKSFWSISVYNAEGYFVPNALNAYTVNNITAERDADGAVTVQFGGCSGHIPNCLPVMDGWNYAVRLYRPDPAILDGSWIFPAAEVVTP